MRGIKMKETIEIKAVENGFVVSVNGDDYKEYIFTKQFQVIRFIKDYFKGE